MKLNGKTALVTGAARGIGAAIATALAKEGASVLLADVLDAPGELLAEKLRSSGLNARFVHLDVSDFEAWKRVVDEATRTEGQVDVLVNNAGVQLRMRIDDLDIAQWQRVLAVNVNGQLFGMKVTAPLMKKNGGGSIVNIASISALGASPNVAYGTSKWAVRGLTKCAAFEYGKWKVRVNAVLPGAVLTELSNGSPALDLFRQATPIGDLVTPENVASVVVFLASDDAAGVTGQDYVVDGGVFCGAASGSHHPGRLMALTRIRAQHIAADPMRQCQGEALQDFVVTQCSRVNGVPNTRNGGHQLTASFLHELFRSGGLDAQSQTDGKAVSMKSGEWNSKARPFRRQDTYGVAHAMALVLFDGDDGAATQGFGSLRLGQTHLVKQALARCRLAAGKQRPPSRAFQHVTLRTDVGKLLGIHSS